MSQPGLVCDPFDLYPLSSKSEIETLVVFAAAVAGRTPKVVWPKVARLRADAAAAGRTPFGFLRRLGAGGVADYLRELRMGQYTRIGAALTAVAALPPGWDWENLVGCPGISYKTAKLVQVYTWPGGRGVCLDRHVLRLLATHPATRRVVARVWPRDTSPADPAVYAAVEGVALWLADRCGLAGWEFDRAVWRAAAANQDPVAALAAATKP